MTLETIHQRNLQLPDAAIYDAWFKVQVQQAIDDPRPSIPAETAREHFAARRDALRQRTQIKE